MAKFEAAEYSRFRVPYPEALFQSLKSFCGPIVTSGRKLRVVDLGSGTGLAAVSFLAFLGEVEFTLVEPDQAMLDVAKVALKNSAVSVSFIHTTAEAFQFQEHYDLVLIGSAWHWFDRGQLLKGFAGSLVSAIFIFEYQFPKALENDRLNEWVRRQFNITWRTQNQVPRGTLIELSEGLRQSNDFHEAARTFIPSQTTFDPQLFFGMIVSQSRFLAHELNLFETERALYRDQIFRELENFWGLQSESRFLVPYEGVLFRRRLP